MKWQEYLYRPTSLLFRRSKKVNEKKWLRLVSKKGLIRYPVEPTAEETEVDASESPETMLGAFFCPNVSPPYEILQIAGLLIKRNKLDRQKSFFSAKRYGGEIYFKWFLFNLGELGEIDPVPDMEFPLDKNRWSKRLAGSRDG